MRHHFFVLLLLSKYHSLDVVRIDLAELLRCGCCVELLHYVRVRLLRCCGCIGYLSLFVQLLRDALRVRRKSFS